MRRLPLVLVAVALAAAGCGGGGASSSALSSRTVPWGVAQHRAAIGELWAAGTIPLCTSSEPVTLTSITPVSTTGSIRVDRIAVRRVKPGGTVGSWPGVPRGLRPVAGFVVPASSPCRWPRRSSPFYEAVVVAERTGAAGGGISGLRVRYRDGSGSGSLDVPFDYALCPAAGEGVCS